MKNLTWGVAAIVLAACAVDGANLQVGGGDGGAGGRNQGGSSSGSGGSTNAGGARSGGNNAGGAGNMNAGGNVAGRGGSSAGGSGGLPNLGGNVTGGNPGAGGMRTGGAGGMSTGGAGGISDEEIRFDFETGVQNWRDLSMLRCNGCQTFVPTQSNVRTLSGQNALAFMMASGGNRTRVVGVTTNNIGVMVPGKIVTFHIWIPQNHHFSGVEAFMQTQRQGSWTGQPKLANALTVDAWNDFSVTIPDFFATEQALELGFLIQLTDGDWSGTVYVDRISFR